MGGNSGGGGQSTQTTVERELSPEQRQLLQKVIPIAEQTLDQGVELFPGSTIAPVNPLETQAQEQAVNAATNVLPQFNENTLATQNFLQSGQAGTLANPALREAINASAAPIIDNLTQNILPNIRSAAVTSGALGGSRQGIAEGLAAQGALRAVGETAAPIANEAFLRGIQAQTAALGLSPQIAQQQLFPSDILSSVGFQQRAFDQALLTEESERFITEQLLPFELAKQVAGLAFGVPGGQTTATAIQPGGGGGGGNRLAGAAGGALSGAAIGTAITPGIGTAIGAIGGGLLGLFAGG